MLKLWNCIVASWAFCIYFILILQGARGWASRAQRFNLGAVETVVVFGVVAHLFLIFGVLGGYNFLGLATISAFMLWGLRYTRVPKINIKDLLSICSLWIIFPSLYFLARFVSITTPHQHSDPLYYHVFAPKFWADSGRIFLEATHPSFSQATLWETLYGVPSVFLKNASPLFRNITTLLAAQSLHFWIGQFLTVWIGAHVISKLRANEMKVDARDFFFSWLACVAPFFEWTGGLAKTDYFLALLTVTGVLALLEKKWFFTGLLLGFAYATKAFAFWSILALPIVVPIRFWALTISGIFVGAAPILARNLIFLGNPFFPALDHFLGPGWLSQRWIQANASFVGAPSFSKSLSWLGREIFSKPLSIVNFGILLAVLPMIRKEKRGTKLFLFVLVQLIIAVSVLKSAAEGRYLGPSLICGALLGYGLLLKNPLFSRKNSRISQAFLLLGLWVNIPLDVLIKLPRDFWFNNADLYIEKFLPIYGWQKWANENLPKTAKLVSLNEKLNYYLDFKTDNAVEMKAWEDLIENSSAQRLVEVLKSRGVDYLHYYPKTSGYTAWYSLPRDIDDLNSACVLCTADSKIIDLKML